MIPLSINKKIRKDVYLDMIQVLFICKGNICRSPMAEAVFRKMIEDAGLTQIITVDSAAIGNWHVGEPPHRGTIQILKKHNIPYETLICRQVRSSDLEQYDYIVAMDDENIAALKRLDPSNQKIFRLLEFVGSISDQNVPDPYYSGHFDETYELVTLGCTALLSKIKTDHKL